MCSAEVMTSTPNLYVFLRNSLYPEKSRTSSIFTSIFNRLRSDFCLIQVPGDFWKYNLHNAYSVELCNETTYFGVVRSCSEAWEMRFVFSLFGCCTYCRVQEWKSMRSWVLLILFSCQKWECEDVEEVNLDSADSKVIIFCVILYLVCYFGWFTRM